MSAIPLSDLAEFDTWANLQVLGVVGALPNPADDRIIHLLGHLLAAKELWLARLMGGDTAGRDLWEKPPFPDLATRLAAADAELVRVSLAAADDDRSISYTNQAGQPFQSQLSEIVMHAVNHGTYHRGQIATAIKAAGGTPPTTDFIAWVRNGRP